MFGEEACYHLYRSGVVDNTGRHGVAIALSEVAYAALLVWLPITSRLANAQLKGTMVKDLFYDNLQDAVDRVPALDMLIILEDWNARPSLVDMATQHILGKFALGTGCPNGDRLVNCESANRLEISRTGFQHLQLHPVTWFSNDGRTRIQISLPPPSSTSGVTMGLKQAENMARTMQWFELTYAYA